MDVTHASYFKAVSFIAKAKAAADEEASKKRPLDEAFPDSVYSKAGSSFAFCSRILFLLTSGDLLSLAAELQISNPSSSAIVDAAQTFVQSSLGNSSERTIRARMGELLGEIDTITHRMAFELKHRELLVEAHRSLEVQVNSLASSSTSSA
jgi:hypothetical protein